MNRFRLTSQRLAAVFLMGGILLNYPLLSLFDHGGMVFGIPSLFLYVFLVWAGLIALMIWIIERRRD